MANIYVKNHQNKASGLIPALRSLGHTLNPNEDPDLLLLDHDAPPYYQRILKAYPRQPVILYPHGATSFVAWDGIWQADPRVNCYLAQGAGEAAAMSAYGYPRPIVVTGWHYCEQAPFSSVGIPERILFAPAHALGNGYMNYTRRTANHLAFRKLAELREFAQITVRHLDPILDIGVSYFEGITYEQGAPDNSTESIDQADLVIAPYGTVAFLAVARGKPTVMYGQDIRPFDGSAETDVRQAKQWEAYREITRYPISIERMADDLHEAIARAMTEPPTEWRERFIGVPLDTNILANALGLYANI